MWSSLLVSSKRERVGDVLLIDTAWQTLQQPWLWLVELYLCHSAKEFPFCQLAQMIIWFRSSLVSSAECRSFSQTA